MENMLIDYSFPLEELEYYLLILTRISTFIFAAPFFGERTTVPRRVKAMLSVFVAFLLYEVITPHVYVEYDTVIQYGVYVVKEALCGVLLGASAQFCMMIVQFAGQLVDMEIGLSMVSLMDPGSGQQVTITGMLYQYTFMLIFIVTGMYQYLLSALAESYQLIPVGEVTFQLDQLFTTIVTFLSQYILLGFQVMIPIFCTILLVNCILGVMAKVSPQMNMFAVGIQIKVLMGFGILMLTVGMLPKAADYIFIEMKTMMVGLVKAMGGGL